jgi:thiamine-phosphate pyrophosphorylase
VIRHFVTDRRRFGVPLQALVARAASAAARGASIIQLRERDLPDLEILDLARQLIEALAGTETRVLINDRPDIALAAGAAGVHLRADSPAASRVRAIVPHGFIVGRSVHSLGEIDAAAADGGCDYLMYGTVFPSTGKPPDHPVAGIERLRDACRRSPLPIIAIGGITPDREAEVARAGAAGLAAVGWFM